MKKILLSILICWIVNPMIMIPQAEEENLYKYWSYRDRLVKDFLHAGSTDGNSIPMSARRIGFPFGNLATFGTTSSSYYWQDATIYLSNYIEVLATEYRLLKNVNGDTRQTLNELYYCLAAINRLDHFAEFYLSHHENGISDDDINGLFLRDDCSMAFGNAMYQSSMEDYSEIFDRSCDFQHMHADNFSHDNWNANEEHTYNKGNVMSLDQVIAIMTSLLFVDELVDPIVVQPTPEDQPLNVVEEAENIAIRIIAYLNNNGWKIRKVNNQDECSDNNLANIEGLVCAGSNCRYFAYPLAETASRILELPVCPNFCQVTDELSDLPNNVICEGLSMIDNLTSVFSNWQDEHCGENSDAETVDVDVNLNVYATLWETMEIMNVQYTTDWGNYVINNLDVSINGEVCLPWYNFTSSQWLSECGEINVEISIDKLAKPFDDDNIHMMYEAATAGNIWNGLYVDGLANTSGLYHIPLMHAILNNNGQPYPWMNRTFFKQSFIDSAPCEGTYAHPYILEDNSGPIWGSSNKLFHFNHMENGPVNAEGNVTTEFRGEFSGLDFMLYYNLYHLLWQDELPSYNRQIQCQCVHEVTSASSQQSMLNINRKFPDYKSKGIPIESYLAHDLEVSSTTGILNVKNDFIICNENPLIPTELTITGGAELNLYSENTITIRKGNTLRISNGSTLNVGYADEPADYSWTEILLEEDARLKVANT